MTKVKPEEEENGNETVAEKKFSRLAVLDKMAMAIVATVLSFVVTQLWNVNKEFTSITNKIELQHAGIQGEQKQIIRSLSDLITNGSQSAQRTEVMVQSLTDRMNRFEDFMSKGRRFTADDGDKLEKKVDKNYEVLDGRINKLETRPSR